MVHSDLKRTKSWIYIRCIHISLVIYIISRYIDISAWFDIKDWRKNTIASYVCDIMRPRISGIPPYHLSRSGIQKIL